MRWDDLLGFTPTPQQMALIEEFAKSPQLKYEYTYDPPVYNPAGFTLVETVQDSMTFTCTPPASADGTETTTTSETSPTVSAATDAINLSAFLIRTSDQTLELSGRWAETLVIPNPTEGQEPVAVYTRTTNGSKGRGNSWAQYDTNEEVADLIKDHRLVGTVSATLSTAEQAELVSEGWSKALATRISHLTLKPSTDVPYDLFHQCVAEANGQVILLRETEAQEAAIEEARIAEEAEAARVAAISARQEKVFEKVEDTSEPETVTVETAVPTTFSQPPEIEVVDEVTLAHRAVAVEIPSGEAVEGYVGRDITPAPNAMTDFQVFDLAAEEHLNVLLVGDTGAGKTTGVRAWARSHGKPCYVVPGNGPLDPPSLFGRFIPEPQTGTFVWIDGPVTTLLRHGGVLVLDEINMISPKVLSVLYPLLDGRREIPLLDHSGEVVHAHKDLMVFATQNEGLGYSGTMPLSHAIKNRFLILRWGYETAVEKQLVKSKTLLSLADRIREQHHSGDIETPTTTNSLMTFERLAARTNSLALATEVFLNRYVDGPERSAVRVVFEGLRGNIEQELGLNKPKVNPKVSAKISAAAAAAKSDADTDNLGDVDLL